MTAEKPVTYLNPPSATSVFGMYSHVAIAAPGGRTAYIAGQVATDASGTIIGPGDMAAQVPVVLGHIERILADLGGDVSCICSLTTYVVGQANLEPWFKARAEAYARMFPARNYPPNTLVVVDGLNRDGLVLEISAIARLPA